MTVKDTKRYPDTDGWGYYNFHHYEPKAATASVRPKGECAYCHMASARYDDVWTQFTRRSMKSPRSSVNPVSKTSSAPAGRRLLDHLV